MMKLIFKWVAIAIGLSVVAVVCFVFLKISFYEQTDNQKHLALKQEYLQNVAALPKARGRDKRPNIVLVLFDDLGYGDIGAFGSSSVATPGLDAIANEGAKLTNYYSPAPVCTPSRVGMLTGRYAPRAGLSHVVFPEGHMMSNIQKLRSQNVRIPSEEITIADTLKSAGYATGIVGKWHIGDVSPSLPNDMGFDYFFGARYSNDMPDFSIYRNEDVIDPHPIDQTTLTQRYTDEAYAFIGRHKDEPFFLYMPHNFPHVPLYTSKQQKGESKAGLYGDVVADLDRSVAALIEALKKYDLADNTLVLITSDNGPWWEGSAGNARGRKADVFEGAMQVPLIAWWPGKIDAGQTLDGIASGVDVFPTTLDLLGLPLPKDRMIDGKSLKGLLLERTESPHELLNYYAGDELFAIRNDRFKYHVRRPITYAFASKMSFSPAMNQGPWLFDLKQDATESYNVSEKYPEVFQQMEGRLKKLKVQMQENPRGWIE